MATSGTYNFSLDLAQVVEEAFERAGSEMRSGYDLRTARRSLNLLFADWANRGLNMWTFEEGTLALVDGQIEYTLPASTVDVMEVYIRSGSGSSQLDLPLQRVALQTYAAVPNKLIEGRPLQVCVDRQRDAPNLLLWPVPGSTEASTYTIVYWRLRRIEDAGHGSNTQDVPFRLVPAMVAGLAYYLAMKVPGGLERLAILKQQYDEAWMLAAEEDREKTSVRFIPARRWS
jgi:hypothetical protein